MTATKTEAPPAAARILKEMLLLGKQRKFGDLLTAEEVSDIPGPGLRAMIDDRQIELLGDVGSSAPGRELATMQRQLTELRSKVDGLNAKMESKLEGVMAELKKLTSPAKPPAQRRAAK